MPFKIIEVSRKLKKIELRKSKLLTYARYLDDVSMNLLSRQGCILYAAVKVVNSEKNDNVRREEGIRKKENKVSGKTEKL